MKSQETKDTNQQFEEIILKCRELFSNKLQDYGASWRVLRTQSVTDQILIKAVRIRNLQELTVSKVDEGQEDEFIGIINYCIIAMIQLDQPPTIRTDFHSESIMELYDKLSQRAFTLMQDKNHDYGEVWREMRVSSITDLILQKLMRVKQIEDNKGEIKVSEGLEANYLDILNYSIFALILLTEGWGKRNSAKRLILEEYLSRRQDFCDEFFRVFNIKLGDFLNSGLNISGEGSNPFRVKDYVQTNKGQTLILVEQVDYLYRVYELEE